MDAVARTLTLYEHAGQTVISNGTTHKYLRASALPWKNCIYFDRSHRPQMFVAISARSSALPVEFSLSLAISQHPRSGMRPYVSNGSQHEWVDAYVTVPEAPAAVLAGQQQQLQQHQQQLQVTNMPNPARGAPSQAPSDTESNCSRGSGLPTYQLLYQPSGDVVLVEATTSGIIGRSCKVPQNPAKDYLVKFSTEHDEYFICSESLQMTQWAPWLRIMSTLEGSGDSK